MGAMKKTGFIAAMALAALSMPMQEQAKAAALVDKSGGRFNHRGGPGTKAQQRAAAKARNRRKHRAAGRA